MRWILLLLATWTVFPNQVAHAQAKEQFPTATFLLTPPGVRNWGMGGAGAALNDPFAVAYNPGGLGVHAFSSQAGLVRNSQNWNPSFLPGVRYTNSLVYAGLALNRQRKSPWPELVVAVAFHRRTFDAHFTIDGTEGSILIDDLWRGNALTVALGLKRGVLLGIGSTRKKILQVSNYGYAHEASGTEEARATTWDHGLFAEVSVQELLTEMGIGTQPSTIGGVTPDVTLAASYAWANRGGMMRYDSGISEWPLPRLTRFGVTAAVDFRYRSATVFGALVTRDEDRWEYQDRFNRREGWELNLMDVVRVQHGTDLRQITRDTRGISVHSLGLTRWAKVLHEAHGAPLLPGWLDGLDVSFRVAVMLDSGEFPVGKTVFREFGIVWRRSALR
jgi:hypothetical protein